MISLRDAPACTRCAMPGHDRQQFARKRDTMFAAGHWGVPPFVVDGEPYPGQGRFDQLLRRLDAAAASW